MYGFSKIEREVLKAIPNPESPKPQGVAPVPSSELARFVYDYAKKELPPKTFNHSLRVYLYGVAIMNDHFPKWSLDPEVIFVTSMLHDIGTTDKNMAATKMSFEFWGGILSRDLILEHTKGNQEYADAVAEAIIRHQDLGETGYITTLGLITQIGTILDNVGLYTHLIHEDTLDAINRQHLRDGWLSCFAGAIENENRKKTWGHTSKLGVEQFPKDVMNNKVRYQKM